MAIFRSRTFGSRMTAFTPMSTTTTSSPKCLARHEAPVLPRVKFSVCARVTDWGAQATPSATTPLSAHRTMMRHRSSLLWTRPVIPDRRMEISSSLPREPGGLASCAWRCRASSITASSAGLMPARPWASARSISGTVFVIVIIDSLLSPAIAWNRCSSYFQSSSSHRGRSRSASPASRP